MVMKNRIFLTIISFLANFIMAGFASQFGMLTEPIAHFYHVDVTTVASIFSLLNAGSLVGTIVAFFLIDKLGVRLITLICYILVLLSAIAMHYSQTFTMVMVAITVIGFCGGIGLCLAGTIIVAIWQNRVQSTMLVIQDATFNVAGVVFPLITTYTLMHGMRWSYSYLVVGLVSIILLAFTLLSDFSPCQQQVKQEASEKDIPVKSEWNYGIISAGVGLFLGMLALYTFLTWSPLFVSQKFAIPFEQAGNVITEYWTAALIGALVSTVIVTRLHIHTFLLYIIGLAAIITCIIFSTTKLSWLSYLVYIYGFVCAALYNSFIAYGVSFVKQASSKTVSFILISGCAGAMFSPAISSVFERILGMQIILYAVPILYAIIFVLLLSVLFIRRKKIRQKQQDTNNETYLAHE